MKPSTLKNQRGQMVVEGILLMMVLVAVVMALRTTIKSSAMFQTLTQAPWRVLSGMITSGVWKSPQDAIAYHPNQEQRHSSMVGTTAP